MSKLQKGFDASLYIALQVAQLHPAVAIAFQAHAILTTGQVNLGNLVGILPSVGPAAKLLGKNARRVGLLAKGDELHHVIPKFMTGWANGRVVALGQTNHRFYHSLLDDAIAHYNLPAMRKGTEYWRDFLELNPGRYDDVRRALIDSVEWFKARTGIDMWSDLMTEMSRQQFLL